MLQTISVRGFSTIDNVGFVQLIDGMDNEAPGLSFAAGNLVGVSQLDLLSAELLPGAASALYGANAFKGILLMNSKNPFDFMALQDVQELTNFFEKTVTAYQVGVEGEVEFSDDF